MRPIVGELGLWLCTDGGRRAARGGEGEGDWGVDGRMLNVCRIKAKCLDSPSAWIRIRPADVGLTRLLTAVSASSMILLDFSRSRFSCEARAISEARNRRFSVDSVDIRALSSSIFTLKVILSLEQAVSANQVQWQPN